MIARIPGRQPGGQSATSTTYAGGAPVAGGRVSLLDHCRTITPHLAGKPVREEDLLSRTLSAMVKMVSLLSADLPRAV